MVPLDMDSTRPDKEPQSSVPANPPDAVDAVAPCADAWIDGVWTDSVSAYDAGFQRGFGVFETIGVFVDGLPLWGDHMARLRHGAAVLGLQCTLPEDLEARALDLLRRNRGDDIVRVTLTGGVTAPTLCLTTRARRWTGRPRQLFVSRQQRARRDPLAAIKCTSGAVFELAQAEARAAGADEALLLGAGKRVLETAIGNVFFRTGERIHTPVADGSFLAGVGRAVLIRELRRASIPVEEADYRLADLRRADEIFVTNAVYGPRPATLRGDCAASMWPAVATAWQRGLARAVGVAEP